MKIFFDDLRVFCYRSKWKFDPPICKSDGKIHLWSNNLVSIKQIESYADGRPKGFIIGYFIPSFIGEPINPGTPNLSDNPPAVGYKHQIYVSLPSNYPNVRSIESSLQTNKTLYIESRSQLFHPRFYLKQESWGCIMVNGEIDRICMNLFQQLLWEPSHVWKDKGQETTNNPRASYLGNTFGKQDVHKYLINKMNAKWGLS